MNRSFLILSVAAVGVFSMCFLRFQQYESPVMPEMEEVGRQQVDEPKPDSPEQAFHWRMLAWMNSNGTIPQNAVANAVAERNAYLEQHSSPDGFGNGKNPCHVCDSAISSPSHIISQNRRRDTNDTNTSQIHLSFWVQMTQIHLKYT